MYHQIIYRKSDGAIARAIAKAERLDYSLVSLGFNPVLYDSLKVLAKDKIEPSKWRVEDKKLVKLVSKEQELMTGFNTEQSEINEGLHIVFVGDATSVNTGFGTQYKILKDGLTRRGYKISELRYQNIPQLVDIHCDFIIALSDYGSVHALFELGLDNLVYWFALESSDWPDKWNTNLREVPHIVPLTRYGAKALGANEVPHSEPIAHGIDPAIYRPFPLRQRGVLRKHNKVDNHFVISYLGTNVERKRLDLLIQAYALFVRDSDTRRESILLLKTKVEGYYDIYRQIEKWSAEYGLSNFADQVRIIEKEMSTQEIAQFINISDLGFNTTSGEGFCIPTIEYMMCGVPFVAGKHSAFPELIGSHLPLIAVDDISIDQRFHWVRSNIDPIHASQILQNYFANWQNGRSYDRQKLREIVAPYTAENMITNWDRYLRDLERKQVEDQYLEKAATGLLNIQEDRDQQRIYERASRAIDVLHATPAQHRVKWIKVF